MSLIHNERTKLTATYINGLAIALFAVGALAPVVTVLREPMEKIPMGTAIAAVVCIGASAGLHWAARAFLGRLMP